MGECIVVVAIIIENCEDCRRRRQDDMRWKKGGKGVVSGSKILTEQERRPAMKRMNTLCKRLYTPSYKQLKRGGEKRERDVKKRREASNTDGKSSSQLDWLLATLESEAVITAKRLLP